MVEARAFLEHYVALCEQYDRLEDRVQNVLWQLAKAPDRVGVPVPAPDDAGRQFRVVTTASGPDVPAVRIVFEIGVAKVWVWRIVEVPRDP